MHLLLYKLLAVTISFCYAYNAQAQAESYTNYTTRDGLSSNHIYSIAQDLDGYIWVGTLKGLCRFDGYEFQCFGSEIGLPNLDILVLTVDPVGRLWIVTRSHAPVYYESGQIKYLESLVDSTRLHSFSVGSKGPDTLLIYRVDSSAWLNTRSLDVLAIEKSKPMHRSFLGQRIKATYNNKLYWGYPNPNEFGQDKLDEEWEFLIPHRDFLSTLKPIKKGRAIEDNSIFWGRTTEGLIEINLQDFDQDPKVHLKGKDVFGVYRDNNENLWIGTKHSGLFRITKNILGRSNNSYTAQKTFASTIDYQKVAGNYIWIVQGNSLKIFNSALEELLSYHIPFSENIVDITENRSNKNIVNIVTTENIWAYNRLLNIITESGIHHPMGNSKKAESVHNGLVILSRRVNHVNHRNENNKIEFTPDARVTASQVLNDSILIFGTSNGIYQYTYHPWGSAKIIKLPASIDITDLKKLSENRIVSCSMLKGIEIYKHENGTLFHEFGWKPESGFIDEILVDEKHVYGVSEIGVYKLNNRDLTLIDFIPTATNKALKHMSIIDEQYVLSTTNSIEVYNDTLKSQERLKTKIIVTEIHVNEDIVKEADLVHLKYNENDIQIKYSYPYFYPDDISFEYQLINHHSKPIKTKDRSISLPNIPSGDFTLNLEVVSKHNQVYDTKNIQITIAKPWWKTHIFILAVFLLIGLMLYLFFSQYKIRQQAKFQLLNQRLRALHAQMNPHFMFNALQSLQYFISKNDRKKAISFLTSFSKLMRKTLESSSNNFISLNDEMEYLTSYLALEKEKYDGNLDYKIDVTDQTPIDIKIPSMVLQPFVENAIIHGFNNRKAPNCIIIEFNKLDSRFITCKIVDNGSGIIQDKPKKSGHKSFASKAVEDKLNLLSQLQRGAKSRSKVSVQTIDNSLDKELFDTGTTVVLKLPFKKGDSSLQI